MSGLGRHPNELIARLAVKYLDDAKKPSWRCVAEDCNHVRQGNAQLDRILKHSTTCEFLQDSDRDLWRDAVKESHSRSLGGTGAGAQLAGGGLDEENNTPGQSQKEEALADERPRKKLKGQTTLDVAALRAAGKKEEEQRRKAFQERIDHAIMRLVCIRDLDPRIIDSPEWKELMAVLNPSYHQRQDTFLPRSIISSGAVFVREKQVELLG